MKLSLFNDPKGPDKPRVPSEPNKKLKKAKKRQRVLRVLNFVFSIVVFGCIVQQGYVKGRCLYNGSRACEYGTAVGIMAFVICVQFALADWLFGKKRRKCIVICDGSLSVVVAFLYFVGFLYLGNQWMKSEQTWDDYGVNNMRAAIVFCAISALTWSFQAYYTFRRLVLSTPALYESKPEDPLPTYDELYGDKNYVNNQQLEEDGKDPTYPDSYVYDADQGFIYDKVAEDINALPPYPGLTQTGYI